MALTLNGKTKWATAKELQRLGETRLGGAPARVKAILEQIETAIAATSSDVRAYCKEHPEFDDVGIRMLQQWEQGAASSLRAP